MSKGIKFYGLVLFAFILTLSGCRDDAPVVPTAGNITGLVTDMSTGSVLEDVYVVLYDEATDTPVLSTVSGVAGGFTLIISEGSYYLRFYKQGYSSLPVKGIDAIPFSIKNGENVSKSIKMEATTLTNIGWIAGYIVGDATTKPGMLIVAEVDGKAYSAITDQDGNFFIVNIPAGTYTLKAYNANFSSAGIPIDVVANVGSNAVLSVTKGVYGSVAGTIDFNALANISSSPTSLDVSLVHPITHEPIPGLSQSITYSTSMSFSFSNVPDGIFGVRVSYANDYVVMDPDDILNNGEYTVTISGGVSTPTTIPVMLTGTVELQSPTNDISSTVPMSETSTTPTFTWTAVMNASDYVIEVIDVSTGAVIWGGFSNVGGITKNITIPNNQTSIVYNVDTNASASLKQGGVYRWKIYASKDNITTGGWNLFAASEDQTGLFIIN